MLVTHGTFELPLDRDVSFLSTHAICISQLNLAARVEPALDSVCHQMSPKMDFSVLRKVQEACEVSPPSSSAVAPSLQKMDSHFSLLFHPHVEELKVRSLHDVFFLEV